MRIRRLMGSQRLLDKTSRRFKMRGESLERWCKVNGISYPYARYCLTGERNGTKALEWRWLIVEASIEDDQHWQALRELIMLVRKWEKRIEETASEPLRGGAHPLYIPKVAYAYQIMRDLDKILIENSH